jgi:HAD superfamily hydrolase (TIGR01662 family)
MSEIILILGPQASGKSTYVKAYVDKGYVRLNRDTEGGSMSGLLAKMKGVMVSGANIVLDNVFATAADRKPFIEAAKFKQYGVRAVVMMATIEECQYNVCQRMIRSTGKLLGPDDFKASKDPGVFPPAVLFKYRKEAQLPRSEEGFTSIDFVPFKREYASDFTNKAIILDKDGTLTECISGGKFPCHADDVRVLKGRGEKLKEFEKQGYKLLGVSNQSGVAKGMTTNQLALILARTNTLLGVDIDWLYCPHKIPPVVCYCRKPGVGLLVVFVEQYKLDVNQCTVVGDMKTDETAAKRCSMNFVLANTFFKE